ncbi:MAG: hypothetical protein AB2693_21065 [Candidatus Thiodiazotropha sp.]
MSHQRRVKAMALPRRWCDVMTWRHWVSGIATSTFGCGHPDVDAARLSLVTLSVRWCDSIRFGVNQSWQCFPVCMHWRPDAASTSGLHVVVPTPTRRR